MKIILGFILGFIISLLLFITVNNILFDTTLPNNKIPKGHVTVTIDLKTEKVIEYIKLFSGNSNQSITPSIQKQTIIIFPTSGEGTFKICYKLKDQKETCGNEHYVEPGYSLKMELSDTELKTSHHF